MHSGGKKVKSSVSSQQICYSTPGAFRDCSVRGLKLECLTQAKSRRLAAPLSPCHNGKIVPDSALVGENVVTAHSTTIATERFTQLSNANSRPPQLSTASAGPSQLPKTISNTIPENISCPYI
ncbi:hypothetical protein PoB_004145200 [Plakobranchus ocellatus]|uniref:Uncharacterized protein n=1 Tax=Plakobranchus ocellatus TaxID=259542 RepID=A0AAV4B604_9GAST|nr:hypothetical protein PoB_004145200 [Plakobranchus ocellatus]